MTSDIFGPSKYSVPKYIYISSRDKYFCSDDGQFYSDEQLDHLIALKSEWEESQDNSNFRQLMDLFPEANKPARRGLKKDMAWHKNRISEINFEQGEYQERVINKADFREQPDLKKNSDKHFDRLRDAQEKKIKSIIFNLSYLDELEGTAPAKVTSGVNESDIEYAKDVPIESFYTDKLHKHGKRATGNCPFHSEKTGSFTIYLDQNSFYCYGCHVGGSVVDYVMMQQNVDFLSAVKQLLK